MALGLAASLRNNQMDEITVSVDGGAGAGTLTIYDGARPATGGGVTTVLAEIDFSDPSFGAGAGGVITANSFTGDAAANATGTATWFRVEDSNSVFVFDGDVGTSGSDLNLNTVAITIGVQVDITSMVLTAGNA